MESGVIDVEISSVIQPSMLSGKVNRHEHIEVKNLQTVENYSL